MRLRLASRFSAIIVAIFALALLSNMMALFAAWRVEKRLGEVAGADMPIADAADEFRAALQEEKVVYTTCLLADGENDWLDRVKRVESRLQSALRVMRGAAGLFSGENASNEGLLARLERTHTEIETQRNKTISFFSQGDKEKAKKRLLAELNGPSFLEADRLCRQLAAAANEHVREDTARVARRVHQAAWVIGVSGGLTAALGGGLLWLLFRRILIPLQGLVTDAQLFNGTLLPSQDRSEQDEMRTVTRPFSGFDVRRDRLAIVAGAEPQPPVSRREIGFCRQTGRKRRTRNPQSAHSHEDVAVLHSGVGSREP